MPVHDSDEAVHRLYAGKAAPLVEAAFPGTVVRRRPSIAPGWRGGAGQAGGAETLEAIVHPLVRADADAFLARHRAAEAPLVVLDIPLLFETGGRDRVDKVVVVTAPADMQRAAGAGAAGHDARRNSRRILAKQVPDAEKRRQADFIIDTGAGLEPARADVEQIIAELDRGKPVAPTA